MYDTKTSSHQHFQDLITSISAFSAFPPPFCTLFNNNHHMNHGYEAFHQRSGSTNLHRRMARLRRRGHIERQPNPSSLIAHPEGRGLMGSTPVYGLHCPRPPFVDRLLRLFNARSLSTPGACLRFPRQNVPRTRALSRRTGSGA